MDVVPLPSTCSALFEVGPPICLRGSFPPIPLYPPLGYYCSEARPLFTCQRRSLGVLILPFLLLPVLGILVLVASSGSSSSHRALASGSTNCALPPVLPFKKCGVPFSVRGSTARRHPAPHCALFSGNFPLLPVSCFSPEDGCRLDNGFLTPFFL